MAVVSGNLSTNPQLELAFDLVRNTNRHLYLTGKAGSGKTTFLRQIKAEGLKRMAVVAPTGVAAINAGGMTIHSLFQIPLGVHLPGVRRKPSEPQPRLRREKILLLRSLDLLVIDEISMVRADLLDAVDEVLRRFRDPKLPFGGAQLLMIGDLYQLAPVVKPDEWELMKQYYETPYFFSSQALQESTYSIVELQHIYRQADPEFIGLLNKVRDNQLDPTALQKLNSRFISNFQPRADQPYITLTATNAVANQINTQNLKRLPGKAFTFSAKVDGDFSPGSYPTEQVLEFKVGTQVMFIRNDTSPERRYFNGKIGQITAIEDKEIWVTTPEDPQPILAQPAEWKNVKYALNEESKQIEEQVLGAFTQVPLRLAWAITIHKSQGLTFDRCIVDAQASFAPGQVYVALSRCKSFDGIVLRSRIEASSVKTDPLVKQFSREAVEKYPSEAEVWQAKREYQSLAINELFRFDALDETLKKLIALGAQHSSSLQPEFDEQCRGLRANIEKNLLRVSEAFAPHLAQYLAVDCLPADHEPLQVRVRKASVYFSEKLTELARQAAKLSGEGTNQQVTAQAESLIDALRLALAVKLACFAACSEGFATTRFQRAKFNAELDFARLPSQGASSSSPPKVPPGMSNPELYIKLWQWRQDVAASQRLPAAEVIPDLTVGAIAICLPNGKQELHELPGIGRGRLRRYGKQLLELVAKYREEHPGAQGSDKPRVRKAPGPGASQDISFAMYRAGKTIAEIGAERELANSTIVGHLAHFVQSGDLDVGAFVEQSKVDDILRYVQDHPEATTAEAKAHFGRKYEYAELRMVLAHGRRLRASSDAESPASNGVVP